MQQAGADPVPDTYHGGQDERGLVEIETAVDCDDLIFSIYRESAEASPWIGALEQLRGSLKANVACLRIAEMNSTAPQQLYAAGQRLDGIADGQMGPVGGSGRLSLQRILFDRRQSARLSGSARHECSWLH